MMVSATTKMMTHMNFWFLLFIASAFFASSDATVVTTKKSISVGKGKVNYYYDDSGGDSCDTVLFIAAGTAMRADSYVNLATDIVNGHPSLVVAIVDDNPHWIMKQNPTKFSDVVNGIAANLSEYIPACSADSNPDFLVGGHSAGGEGSILALIQGKLNFDPVGYIGLSPFIAPKTGTIDIPTLFWGFSRTSCCVIKDWASLRAYGNSNPDQRVFYQLQTHNWNLLFGGPHCSYTDKGCPGWNWIPFLKACHGTKTQAQEISPAVATSIHVFIQQIKDGNNFSSAAPFQANQLDGTKLFFGSEAV